MVLNERDKLERIGAAVYRKIMSMDDVAEFKVWMSSITALKIKNFCKNALQELKDERDTGSAAIQDILDNL